MAHLGRLYLLTAVSAVASTILAVLISTTILVSRAAPPKIVEPPLKYLPGNPLPEDARCNWPPNRTIGVLYCHISVGDNRVYLTYDPQREVIVRSSIEISRQSVGDLLAAWGTPTGLTRSRWSVQVQWGSRYVYVFGRPFQPENPIFFIFYSLDRDQDTPWNGFANPDR